MCSIVRVWPQCWEAVCGPRDKIWDFVALVWPIRSRVITTSSALVRCRNLLGGPSVGFRRYRSLPCIDTSHKIWTSCWMEEFTIGFKSVKWTVVSGSMSWSRVSFASWSTISFPSMPQWLGTQQKWTRSAFVAQCPEEIYDLANERVFSIFAFNCLQARHWVRLDYDIVLYRIHVPIIVQCQYDCCCLSSKDGTVIWESFGQLAASLLTILKMAVDDRCCPHSRQS